MKIAVIGAGAMGSLYGAYLSKKNDVILIDSNAACVDAMNEAGITVVEKNGQQHKHEALRAYCSGTCTEHVDLVIVFVKSTYTQVALEQNRSLFKSNPIVLTLQNGAGNDRAIAQYVPEENIVVGTSKHNAIGLEPGKCMHPCDGVTTIGSKHCGSRYAQRIQKIFVECGLETVVSEDIQRIIWSKLFVNLSVNTITALTETPIGYMVQNASAWNFAEQLIREAVTVAKADGTSFDEKEVLCAVRQVCIDAGEGYSSMYQDRKKKVKMEVDTINGAIVEQAKLYGIPTPCNSLMVDLIHAIEGTYSKSWDSKPGNCA